MTKKRQKTIWLLLTFLILNVGLYGAIIEGRVTDYKTGDALIGANVVLGGSAGLGAASDRKGYYKIYKVPPGEYIIKVSYIGYRSEEIEIKIRANETLVQDVELLYSGALKGEEVIVTAQATGELSAINQQIRSNTITNIVDESKIKELPDANAAESVGRLPGVAIKRSGGEATKVTVRGLSPKYNMVTVNGVRIPATGANDRSVDLSLISSNMLNGIEVIKAALPDQDANSFGGTIDLKLTEAKPEASLDVSLQGGYSNYRDIYGNYDFNVSYSNRFFNNKLGLKASVHSEKYDRSADKFSGSYVQTESIDPTKGRVIKVSRVGLREENVTRRRNGGVLALDYKIPDGKISANTFYNRKDNKGIYNIRVINSEAGRQYWDATMAKSTSSILINILGINQDFGWIKYDATIAKTSSKFDQPENYRWRAEMLSGVMNSIPDENTHPDSLPGMVNLDSPIKLSHIWVDKVDREENRTSAKFNVEMPFFLGNAVSGNIKTGVKISWLDRYNDQDQNGRGGLLYGTSQGTQISINDYWGQIDSLAPGYDLASIVEEIGYIPVDYIAHEFDRKNFLEGRYNLEYVFNQNMMETLTHAFQRTKDVFDDKNTEINESFYRNHAIGSRGSDYNGDELYQAGYIMGTINLGKKITLIPGIRWEGFRSKYQGQRFRAIISGWQNLDPVDLDTLKVKRTNEFWLPMIHLQYKPLDWLKVRLARTETVSRPNYSYYAPITYIDGYETSIKAVNSQIRPSHATNYDLSLSVYQNKVGLFTVSPFYKIIEDHIIPVNFQLHPDIEEKLPEGLNIPESWYENRPSLSTNLNNTFNAYYKGIEFSWRTNFWYLPSFLKGLVLGLNYTYIESSTKYKGYRIVESDSIKSIISRPGFKVIEYYKTLEDTSRSGRMLDQPTHVGNITLGYDYKGFSVRLTYLYQSDIASFIHSVNPLFDTFTSDYSRIDMQIKQKITPKIEIYGNYRNISETADRTYRASSTFNPSYLEFYGSTIDIGIRYRM